MRSSARRSWAVSVVVGLRVVSASESSAWSLVGGRGLSGSSG